MRIQRVVECVPKGVGGAHPLGKSIELDRKWLQVEQKYGIMHNMISIILAIVAAGGVFCAANFAAGCGIGWSIFWGILGFGLFQFGFGYFIRKRMTAEMEKVQGILAGGQKKLEAKMKRWEFRPPGSIQAAQKEMLDDTKLFVHEALKESENLNKYRMWVPMIDRQAATMKVQLHWMVKEWKDVDKYMPKALMLDPMMVAMKMARMYMLGEKTEAIGKIYEKTVKRLKYNQNVVLAALWSWILVQRNEVDAAFKVLTEALKKSDDETLKRNHTELMNNRVAHFNNSGLGDKWYTLMLEEPRVKAQRQHNRAW